MLALLLFKYIYDDTSSIEEEQSFGYFCISIFFNLPNNPTSQQLLLRYYRVWKLKWNKKKYGKENDALESNGKSITLFTTSVLQRWEWDEEEKKREEDVRR